VHTISHRVGRFLEWDAENSYLALDAVHDDPMNSLLGHSITYRIAMGPLAGRKVFTFQTLPACDPEGPFGDSVGKVAGFSLYARTTDPEEPTPAERRATMTWAQRLKRLFRIDIETCTECGGPVKVIACIEAPVLMPKALAALAGQALKQILDYLKHIAETNEPSPLPESRAPPAGLQQRLFD
jgi:hypothetical protein